jgi:mannose-6-phosphate isomerase-like protein (cupin superfamily)
MAITELPVAERWKRISIDYTSPYDLYLETLDIPVHSGYYVEDIRTIELGWWPERGVNAAILKLAGNEGITESRVSEIPPGATTKPIRFALDEAVYVASGRGLTTVTPVGGGTPRTFEWQPHSLFMIPRNTTHQFSNVSGNTPARLLHYNYLPMSMAIQPDPEFYFDNPFRGPDIVESMGADFSSEAKVMAPQESNAPGLSRGMAYWYGNFFPDMQAWDKLVPFKGRGAGGHVVWVRFPASTVTAHMSVFPPRSYKKAHRHGPGVVIVIPSGEGYSVMWPEGQDKQFIPWHEGSVFVPPNRWYHQHFNVGSENGRYLAFHAMRGFTSERVEDRARDQIEYPDEDPVVRQRFESELGKRGLQSLMPEQAYKDHSFEWDYNE